MNSRLQSLPAELRLQIYENVLVDSRGGWYRITPLSKVLDKQVSPYSRRHFRFRVWTSLLRTCRLIYLEATAVLYSGNGFVAGCPAGLMRFLYGIGRRNATFIRRVKLHLGYPINTARGNWHDAFCQLARQATDLRRLEIEYLKDMVGLLQHGWPIHPGLGKDTTVARTLGKALTRMFSLKTLVIRGFYGKNWPAYFATKTKAVVETHPGFPLPLAPRHVAENESEKGAMEWYQRKVALAQRQVELYQWSTEDLLAEEIAKAVGRG